MPSILRAMCLLSLPLVAALDDANSLDWYHDEYTQTGRSLSSFTSSEEGVLWSKALSWGPRVFLYHNFLNKTECNALIHLAAPKMKQVGDAEEGPEYTRLKGKDAKHAVVAAVEDRIARTLVIPTEQQEPLEVYHYGAGHAGGEEADFRLDADLDRGLPQRIATALLFLSDVEEGGETVFPRAPPMNPGIASAVYGSEDPFSDCVAKVARGGTFESGHPPAAIPRRGDALIIWTLTPNGEPDKYSMHRECPILRGDKWVAVKYVQVGLYKES